LSEYLARIEAKEDESNPCIYKYGEGDEVVILIFYVDDLMLASKNIKRINELKKKLKSEFHISYLGPVSKILGINVEREGTIGKIQLNQRNYINEIIERFGMQHPYQLRVIQVIN